MENFIGRESELRMLERIYSEESVKTCIVSGRRRIGKSSLLRKFAENRRSIIVQFVRSSEIANVEIIRESVKDLLGYDAEINTLHSALSLLKDACSEEKTLLIFDEVPYLLDGNDTATTEMQHFVDSIRSETDSMVVMCGSSVSFMMEEVLKKKKPLYGRFAFNIELKPLSLQEVRKFHPSISDTDLMRLYLTLGGVPAYHEVVGDTPYADAVDKYLMNKFAMIVNDIPYDLSEELGGMAGDAFSILESISSGHNTYAAIMGRTGLNDNRLSGCLKRLCGIHVIEKMNSVPEARKSNIYVISDRLTSFYFAIIQRYQGLMSSNIGVYESIRPMLYTHLGREFESFCRDLVTSNYPCENSGSWWGPIPIRDDSGDIIRNRDGKPVTEDVDIDVTATIRMGQNRMDLFGECKFTTKKMGFSALNRLEERIGYLNGRYNNRLALFSMSGFEDDLEEYAESNGVLLFGPDVLMGLRPVPDLD